MSVRGVFVIELSFIIPVYNEYESLPHLHPKVTAVAQELGVPYEIIYIDDGSQDGSTKYLIDMMNQDLHVVVVVQRRNFGKSSALKVGFQIAQGRKIITMDADLQDEPQEVPRLLQKLDEGYDVVTGWKKVRQDPLSKRLPSRIANKITSMFSGIYLHDMNSGFKAYTSQCVRNLHLYGDLHRYIPVLAHYAGFRVAEIPVTHHKRQYGHSKYGSGRLLRGGLDLLTVMFINQYGRRPLHLFGGIGAIMIFVGLTINLILTLEWLIGDQAIGSRPALLLGVMLMLMGVQIVSVGLLAELIVHFIQRSEDPFSTVQQIYKHSSEKEQSENTSSMGEASFVNE